MIKFEKPMESIKIVFNTKTNEEDNITKNSKNKYFTYNDG